MTATATPTPSYVWCADGEHRGIRWFLIRIDGELIASCNGFPDGGSDYLTEATGMPDGTPKQARAWVDTLLEARGAKIARKARR